MHTIKLKVHDNIYSHIIYLLKNLNQNEVEILEDKELKEKQSTKDSVKKLFKQKKIEVFKSIQDPLIWQKQQRDEW